MIQGQGRSWQKRIASAPILSSGLSFLCAPPSSPEAPAHMTSPPHVTSSRPIVPSSRFFVISCSSVVIVPNLWPFYAYDLSLSSCSRLLTSKFHKNCWERERGLTVGWGFIWHCWSPLSFFLLSCCPSEMGGRKAEREQWHKGAREQTQHHVRVCFANPAPSLHQCNDWWWLKLLLGTVSGQQCPNRDFPCSGSQPEASSPSHDGCSSTHTPRP
jgi:hypothetical protein